MSNNDTPNDLFGFADTIKQIADAWNEGLEQAKRQSECKMRRFTYVDDEGRPMQEGLVFPDGQVVVQGYASKAICVFSDYRKYTTHHPATKIKWIDPEVAP